MCAGQGGRGFSPSGSAVSSIGAIFGSLVLGNLGNLVIGTIFGIVLGRACMQGKVCRAYLLRSLVILPRLAPPYPWWSEAACKYHAEVGIVAGSRVWFLNIYPLETWQFASRACRPVARLISQQPYLNGLQKPPTQAGFLLTSCVVARSKIP